MVAVMATNPRFDLFIHCKDNVGKVYNVDPDIYCHIACWMMSMSQFYLTFHAVWACQLQYILTFLVLIT